jgi:hypothetical protein
MVMTTPVGMEENTIYSKVKYQFSGIIWIVTDKIVP